MYKKSLEFIVGLFILLALVALAFLALKVSGLSLASFHAKSYEVKAEFSDIGALRLGAAVRIAGVEIGSVKSISLMPSYNGFVATVDMSLDNKYNKIPASYSASIQTSDSFIALETAKINLPGLYQGEYLKNGSVIPLANTGSAINLNALVNTFVSGQGAKKA